MQWYAIRTKPLREFAARDAATAQTIAWLPVERVERRCQDARGRTRLRRHTRPLCPGYLFTRAPVWPTTLQLEDVIIGPLCLNGEPVPITGEALAPLADLDRRLVTATTARPPLTIGQIVKLAVGQLAGFTGRVAHIDGDKLDVIVDLFGKPNAVRVSSGRVEAA